MSDLPLIRDALNRVARTVAQQSVVLASDAALIAALDVSKDRWWPTALLICYHLLASATLAYLHRSVLDPSRVGSLEPPDVPTPTFAAPPLEPAAPFEY